MTMVTISDNDPRSIKAVQIAAGARQWLKVRAKDGRKFYGVPSSCTPDRYYLVTTEACDCRDAQWHAGQPCKHTLAVRLHVALVKGQRPKPKPSAFVASHTDSAGNTVFLPRRRHTDGPFKGLPITVRED